MKYKHSADSKKNDTKAAINSDDTAAAPASHKKSKAPLIIGLCIVVALLAGIGYYTDMFSKNLFSMYPFAIQQTANPQVTAGISSASPQSTPSQLPTTTPASSSTPVPTPTPAAVSYTADLGGGNYTAGIDFPAGKYTIEAIYGGGNVISDNMENGGINAIMGTASMNKEDTKTYTQSVSNIDLPEGTVLTVKGGVRVRISCDQASGAPLQPRNQTITETITLESGQYIAGTDFPAGIYDIKAIKENGTVYSDNMHLGGINAIMGVDDTSSSLDVFELEYKNIVLTEGVKLNVNVITVELIPSK